MNKSNRVLTRLGARELNLREMEQVSGGFAIRTATLCTALNLKGQIDGDRGEC
jgi:hypothetical protein